MTLWWNSSKWLSNLPCYYQYKFIYNNLLITIREYYQTSCTIMNCQNVTHRKIFRGIFDENIKYMTIFIFWLLCITTFIFIFNKNKYSFLPNICWDSLFIITWHPDALQFCISNINFQIPSYYTMIGTFTSLIYILHKNFYFV